MTKLYKQSDNSQAAVLLVDHQTGLLDGPNGPTVRHGFRGRARAAACGLTNSGEGVLPERLPDCSF